MTDNILKRQFSPHLYWKFRYLFLFGFSLNKIVVFQDRSCTLKQFKVISWNQCLVCAFSFVPLKGLT
jgi:hypothetical protein